MSVVLGARAKILKRHLIMQLQSAALNRRMDRRQTRGKTTTGEKQAKTWGFLEYRRENWTPGLNFNSPAGIEEQRRIGVAWKLLSPLQKIPYETQAGERNASISRGEEDRRSQYGMRRQKKAKAFDTIRSIINHRIWKSGAELDSFGCALHPSKLDTDMPDEQCKAQATKIVGYDSVIIKNSGTNPQAEVVLEIQFPGL